ncbi:MAG: flavodoxin domain-containing protein [Candidatus Kariarchaeaceae archaeon]
MSTHASDNKIQNGHKVLVAYETGSGSTEEVADFIGNILSQDGNIVEIKNIRDEIDLTSYDSIIIGSANRYDNWMSNARKFVKNNQKILSKMPVAFFFTCLVLSTKTDKTIRQAKGYSDKLFDIAPQVKPISVGGFAGVLDYSKISLLPRLILKLYIFVILRLKERVRVREGDYRDWDAINSWVKSINFR